MLLHQCIKVSSTYTRTGNCFKQKAASLVICTARMQHTYADADADADADAEAANTITIPAR